MKQLFDISKTACAHWIAFILQITDSHFKFWMDKYISMKKELTLQVCSSEQNNVPHMYKCGVL